MTGDECRYCRATITEADMAAHYVHCHYVRLALDDSYNPYANSEYRERNAKRVATQAVNRERRKQAKIVRQGDIVISQQSSRNYFNNRRLLNKGASHGNQDQQAQQASKQAEQSEQDGKATNQA